jgi:segregation and condensation protein A
MTIAPAKRAIALLIEMAGNGEIDPWDVKVIDVIDRFLDELRINDYVEQAAQGDNGTLSFSRARYENDLLESGQAFLYASMLVLLKADTLIREELESQEPEEYFDEGDVDDRVVRLPLNLDQQLRRRAAARPPEQRRVTLAELIEQLEIMALALESPKQRPKPMRARQQTQRQAIRIVSQLAHQENLAEVVEHLGGYLDAQWTALSPDDRPLDFDRLVQCWQSSGVGQDLAGTDRVGVFWALLFLSAQGKVELSQTDLYGSLAVQLIPAVEETQPVLDPRTDPLQLAVG